MEYSSVNASSNFPSFQMIDSLSESIKKCATHRSYCLRAQCVLEMLETFDVLCGGCLKDWVQRAKTAQELWCHKGTPDKVSKAWCDSQYKVIEQPCRKCGNCGGAFDSAKCDSYQETFLCVTMCNLFYAHFDAVCALSKDGSGKHDPKRHAEKIKHYVNTAKDCRKQLAKCAVAPAIPCVP